MEIGHQQGQVNEHTEVSIPSANIQVCRRTWLNTNNGQRKADVPASGSPSFRITNVLFFS